MPRQRTEDQGPDEKAQPKVIKPFLRWAGGKQWLSRQLAHLVSTGTGTYYEPFVGGGSLYFTALPAEAVLSDINPRLIDTYETLRDDPLGLIAVLTGWNNDAQTYYEVRRTQYTDSIHRAAQLIFLNRTCWNGLYRVNGQGQFNVPFGHHNRPVFDSDHLLEVSNVLRAAKLRRGDFEQTLATASCGDFVYLDPPYTALHTRKGFRQYNERLFGWHDQERLAHVAVELAKRGCSVVVSNAHHEEVLDLYQGFLHRVVSRHSILAADPQSRRVTTELVILSDSRLSESFDGWVK